MSNETFQSANPNSEDANERPVDETARGPDALAELLGHLAEALDYVGYLLAAEVDQIRLRLRRALIIAALGVLGAIVGVVVVCASVWLALSGLAGGIGALCGGRPWLGSLIVGGTILLGGAAAIWFGLRRWRKSALARVKRRYAARRAGQAERFGRTVREEAQAKS